jgi:hypothetical protein
MQQQRPETQVIDKNTGSIIDAVQEVLRAEDSAKAAVQDLITLKIRAGQMLIAKREELEHGDWMPWCAEQLPISYETANRWIGLFNFARKNPDALDDAKSVRQAYVLAGLLPESQGGNGSGGSSQSPDAYLTLLVRGATHLSAEIAKRPLIEWPDQDRCALRDRLKPYVDLYVELNATA